MRFLILGGYGNAGRLIAETLLEHTEVEVLIAGRRPDRAEAVAVELGERFGTARVAGRAVDASEPDGLCAALADADCLVVASSTTPLTSTVAEAALDAGVDYFDIQISSPAKLDALTSLTPRIAGAGRCFITDGGLEPGVPGALVRYAATQCDRLEKANVAALLQVDWKEISVSGETAAEFVELFSSMEAAVFEGGGWMPKSFRDYRTFDFGPDFGRRACIPFFLEELRHVSEELPDLEELGFYEAGFNWFTDYLVTPVIMAGLKLSRATAPALGHLFGWSVRQFGKPPYGIILRLEAEGVRDHGPVGITVTLKHTDSYVMTAAPAVACLLQYLDGSIRKPGLWWQANAVEPVRFLRDIERLGVPVERNQGGTDA